MLVTFVLGLALAMSCACGRLHFDLTTDDGGTSNGDAPPDIIVVSSGTWSAPIAFDLGIGADDPTMTADGLELYVNNGSRVYVSTRSSKGDPFPPVTLVNSLPSQIYSPHLSPDGLTLWGTTTSPSRIIVTTRATRTDSWGTYVDIPEITDASGDDGPSVSSDGLTMVFDSFRGTLAPGIFVSERASVTAPWSTPVPLSELDVAGFAGRPHMTDDGLEIYFQGPGNDGGGDNDLWVARRASRTQPFGAPQIVPELDTAVPEEDPWVSADGRTLLFAGLVGGMARIQQATR